MNLPKRTARGYGWRPDLPDARDYSFHAARAVRTPPRVDLRASPAMPSVWDQGDYGSCTAHAVGGALAFAYHFGAGSSSDPDAFMPSRMFIYRGERVIEGDAAEDGGAEIRDGFKVIAKLGAPDEARYPYDGAHFNKAFSSAVLRNAAKHRATRYERIDNRTAQSTLVALAMGRPVAFGFSVYESFESDHVAESGLVPMPRSDEQILGGHAVLAVGYVKAAKLLIVRNSWGASWGEAGYCYFPFAYAFDTNLADDFWVCQAAA